jgi:hypothetical protein
MENLNNDIFLYIMDFLILKDKFVFVSSMTGRVIGVSCLKYRDYYFRKISANKLNNCFYPETARIIIEEVNCLRYYNKLERNHIINCELLDFTFCWLSEKTDTFLFGTNIHKYQSCENNYFNNKIIIKKIAYSTGLRDRVFIKNNTAVCSVYGCKMLGTTRRKIMRSLVLKALVG